MLLNRNERRGINTKNIKTITAFIQEVISILNNYENEDFEDFFSILNDEMRKYHYRGCKFYEITENPETRKQLAAILELIRAKPIAETEANISILAKIIKDENYSRKVKEFVDYINSLYIQDGEEKFAKILSALRNYRGLKYKRKGDNLSEIIKEAVRSVIFDHYTDLNANARRELKGKIELLWETPRKIKPSTYKKFIDYTVATIRQIANTTNEVDETEDSTKEFLPSTVRGRKENSSGEEKIDTDDSDEESQENQHKSEESSDTLEENDIKPAKSEEPTTKTKKNVKRKREKTHKKPKTSFEESERESKETTEENEMHGLSSFDSDSEKANTGESIASSSNSIEFSQERQKEYNTKRYVTLFPEEITYRSERLAKEAEINQRAKAKSRKKTTFESVQRMWVEESTGGIPKYILNKYTTPTPKHKFKDSSNESRSRAWSKNHRKRDIKKKHISKKQKHLSKKHKHIEKKQKHVEKKQKHVEKNQKHHKHDSKNKALKKKKAHFKPKHIKHEKHKSPKHIQPRTVKHEHKELHNYQHRPEVVRYTKLDIYYDFKRGFDDVVKVVDFTSSPKEEPQSSAQTKPGEVTLTKMTERILTTPKPKRARTLKLKGLGRPTPILQSLRNDTEDRYSNQFELWDQHSVGDMRKSAAPPLKADEALSLEEFKRQEQSLRKSIGNETLTGYINPNLLNKLNNLEKELDVVKAKINGSHDANNTTEIDSKLEFMKNVNDDANVKLVNEDFKKNGSKDFVKMYHDIVGKLHEKPTTNSTVKPKHTSTVKSTTKTKKTVTNATTVSTTTKRTNTTQKVDKSEKKNDSLSNTVPLMESKGDTNKTVITKETKIQNNKTVIKDDKNATKITEKSKDSNTTDVKTVSVTAITSKSRRMMPTSATTKKVVLQIYLGNPKEAQHIW
uniref:Uncharacterized protein n=1 Tax=Heliothis virescens TaxID=7102 RepID=A0A2A4JH51_HELVI